MLKKLFVSLFALLLVLGNFQAKAEAKAPDVASPQYVIIPVSKTFTATPRSDVTITITGSYQRTGSNVNNIKVSAYASNSLATVETVSSFQNGSGIMVVVYYRVYGYSDVYNQIFYF